MPEQLSAAVISKRRTWQLKDGTVLELCQLRLRDYVQLQEQALADHKRRMIRTWTDNADLLPPEQKNDLIRDAFQRASELKAEDMPTKKARVPVLGKDGKPRRQNGVPMTEIRDVPYSAWWIAETPDGKLHAAWMSLRRAEGQEGITLDDVDAIFCEAMQELEEVANVIGEMSESELAKNSPAPEDSPGEPTGT